MTKIQWSWRFFRADYTKVPNLPQNVKSSTLFEVHAYMGNVWRQKSKPLAKIIFQWSSLSSLHAPSGNSLTLILWYTDPCGFILLHVCTTKPWTLKRFDWLIRELFHLTLVKQKSILNENGFSLRFYWCHVTLTLYKPDTSLRRTDTQARPRRCPSSRELIVSNPIYKRGN